MKQGTGQCFAALTGARRGAKLSCACVSAAKGTASAKAHEGRAPSAAFFDSPANQLWRVGTAMRALVYEGPRALVWHDLPELDLGTGEVLVAPLWNGICGSDLHAYQHATPRRTPPIVMGHEFSGRIVESCDSETELKPAEVVAVRPVHWCGKCELCLSGRENVCPQRMVIGVNRPGSYADVVAVSADQCVRLPEGLDPMVAALAEPVSVALHALSRAGDFRGREIVILGAGTIGLLAVIVARSMGAGRVTAVDVREVSLDHATRFGADVCVNAAEADSVEAVRKGSGGRGVPVVLEAVGSERTIQQAVSMAEPGGMVVLMGMGPQHVRVDALDVTAREIHLCGSYASGLDFADAIPILKARQDDLVQLIGPIWPFEQAIEAFEDYDAHQHERFKVVIQHGRP